MRNLWFNVNRNVDNNFANIDSIGNSCIKVLLWILTFTILLLIGIVLDKNRDIFPFTAGIIVELGNQKHETWSEMRGPLQLQHKRGQNCTASLKCSNFLSNTLLFVKSLNSDLLHFLPASLKFSHLMFLRLSWSLFNPFPGGGRASQWTVRYLHLRSCCLGFKPRGSRNFTSTGMGKRRNWSQRSWQVWKYPEEDSRIYKCVERSHWGAHGFVLRGKRGHCPQDFMLEFSFHERTLEMEAVVAKNEGSVCGVKWSPVMS